METSGNRLSQAGPRGWFRLVALAGSMAVCALLPVACDSAPVGANPSTPRPPEAPGTPLTPSIIARVRVEYNGTTGRLTTKYLPLAAGNTRIRANVLVDSLLEQLDSACTDCGNHPSPGVFHLSFTLRVKSSDYVVSNLACTYNRLYSDSDALIEDSNFHIASSNTYFGSSDLIPITTTVNFLDTQMDKTFTVVFDISGTVYKRTG